jgi:hypothetical protein
MNFLKTLKLIHLEVIATIAWFVTDYLWMWGQVKLALLFLPFIIVSMGVSLFRIKNKNLRKIIMITFMWLIMNSLWMVSDLYKEESTVTNIKLVATLFGFIGMGQLAFFFVTNPKQIQNFKRFLNLNYNEA